MDIPDSMYPEGCDDTTHCARRGCEEPVQAPHTGGLRTEFDGKLYCSQGCAMQDAGLWVNEAPSHYRLPKWEPDLGRVTELAAEMNTTIRSVVACDISLNETTKRSYMKLLDRQYLLLTTDGPCGEPT